MQEYYISPTGQKFSSKEVYWTQLIRLADVFVIGPSIIYTAFTKQIDTKWRVVLFIIGLATIIYNGRNYIRTMK